ncbi:BrnT family toxin [Candidatus Woesebacteria bacterium]|nr:BrnT family toxin [Candidatus Woesebacteria bacterium]
MRILPDPLTFQWDPGNRDKNFLKHSVSNTEIEEAFYDQKKKIFKDKIHSGKEERYRIIAKTNTSRLLFIVFTIRDTHVRIISARDLNKKEEYLYEKKT